MNSDVEEVLRAISLRDRALVEGDAEGLTTLLADEYMYIHGSGRVESKAEYIRSVALRNPRFLEFSRTGVVVNIYGNIAVALGQIAVKREIDQRVEVAPFRFASVWHKSPTWQLTVWQHTSVRDKSKPR